MSLDEYIYGKIAKFLKVKRKKAILDAENTVKLEDVVQRLTIFSRAVTGSPIDIYPAKREGGYKNNNLFLPSFYSEFETYEDNLSFYLFRVLYLSIQKSLNINWQEGHDHDEIESRFKAENSANEILKVLFDEFPITN